MIKKTILSVLISTAAVFCAQASEFETGAGASAGAGCGRPFSDVQPQVLVEPSLVSDAEAAIFSPSQQSIPAEEAGASVSSDVVGNAASSLESAKARAARLLRLAETGDVNAQFGYAMLCAHGTPYFKRNPSEANFWCLKSATGGNVSAQYQMGRAFEYGLWDIEKNRFKAFDWYTLAFEEGHSAATVAYCRLIGIQKPRS